MSNARDLEILERRQLCSLSVWTGAAGDGMWHTAANWDTLAVPAPNADVVIDVPAQTPVRFLAAAGEVTIRSLVCREAFVLEGGSLTVVATARFEASLSLEGGVMACGGTCDLGPAAAWNAATLSGAGAFICGPSSTLMMGGVQSRTLSARLENHGTVELVGNPSLHFSGGTLVNHVTGVVRWTGAGNFLAMGGMNQFTNAGTFTKSGSSSGSVTVPLTSTGRIEVQASPLLLFVPGTLGGVIDIAPAGTLALGGDFAYQPGVQIRGGGHLIFSSGTHVLPAGSMFVTGVVDFDSGSITLNDPIVPSNGINIPTTTTLTLNASQSIGVLQTGGVLSGSGDLTVTSSFTWTAGSIGGSGRLTVAAGATMISSGNGRFLSRTLDNRGSATLQTPGTLFFSNAVLTNYGTFTLNASMNNGAGTNLFRNLGQITKSAGASITVTVPFNNAGSLANASGGITFTSLQNYVASSSSLVGGSWTLSAGATLSISGAFITTLATGTSVTLDGPGTAIGQAASLSINRGTLRLSNGRAFGFTAAGNVFHNHGVFAKDGSGATTIPATLTFNNYGVMQIDGGELSLPGPTGGGGQLQIGTSGRVVLGRNQVFSSIQNNGTIDAALFRLSATVSFTQTPTATLVLAIQSPVTYGQLAASGTCVLDGSLVVESRDGFDAAAGAPDLRARLIESGLSAGAFASITLPPTAMGAYALVPIGGDLVLMFNFADANADGGVDGSDVDFYFMLWENGSLLADVNGDGGVDGSDLSAFFAQWEQGGPG